MWRGGREERRGEGEGDERNQNIGIGQPLSLSANCALNAKLSTLLPQAIAGVGSKVGERVCAKRTEG